MSGTHLDLIRGRQVAIPLTNKSGETCNAGTVVILSEDYDAAFELTTTEGDERVVGVVDETIRNNESGRVVCSGYVSSVLVSEQVNRGDFLVASEISGKATGKPDASGAGCLGIALSSGAETVFAYLFHAIRGPQGIQGIQGIQGVPGAQGVPGPIAGANTQVIFNDSGSAAGNPGLTYNKAQQDLTVGNRVNAANVERVKVSSNDTTPDFLVEKIVAGDNITLTEVNDGGDEALRVTGRDHVHAVVMSRAGTLEISSYPFNIYPGLIGKIAKVRIAVSSAPMDSSIIVDVNKNGVTIFTNQDHRPKILSEEVVGETTDIDVDSIGESDYLEFDIDQVGSALPGSYLTVHVYIKET